MLQSVGLQSRTRLSDWTATTRDISRRGKSTETGGRLVVSRTGRKEAAGERSDSSVGTELLFVGMKSTKLDSDSSRTVNVLRATELDMLRGRTSRYVTCKSITLLLKSAFRASLVAQWLRIRLPKQETRVQSLSREDPSGRGAAKPVSHSYYAGAIEPGSRSYGSPRAPEPVLGNERGRHSEKPARRSE